MGVSEGLTKEVKGIAIMVVVIVVFSIVLLKFKAIDGVTTGLNTTIDTTVAALDEPVSWIVIIVIILVVAWLMKYLKSKGTGMEVLNLLFSFFYYFFLLFHPTLEKFI